VVADLVEEDVPVADLVEEPPVVMPVATTRAPGAPEADEIPS